MNESFNVQGGEKDTTGTTVKATFQNSTAVSGSVTTQANVTLDDIDNTTQGNNGPSCKDCHDPIRQRPAVNIYMDKVFGSFMFQDPAAPAPPAGATSTVSCCSTLFRVLAHQEQNEPRFSDVPASDPLCGAIGLLARLQVMPSVTKTDFQPSAMMTTSDLTSALNVLSHRTGAPVVDHGITPLDAWG